jgi:hypothetical protein
MPGIQRGFIFAESRTPHRFNNLEFTIFSMISSFWYLLIGTWY